MTLPGLRSLVRLPVTLAARPLGALATAVSGVRAAADEGRTSATRAEDRVLLPSDGGSASVEDLGALLDEGVELAEDVVEEGIDLVEAEPRSGSIGPPAVGPRPVPFPKGPVEEWSERISLASLAAFGTTLAATRAVRRTPSWPACRRRRASAGRASRRSSGALWPPAGHPRPQPLLRVPPARAAGVGAGHGRRGGGDRGLPGGVAAGRPVSRAGRCRACPSPTVSDEDQPARRRA